MRPILSRQNIRAIYILNHLIFDWTLQRSVGSSFHSSFAQATCSFKTAHRINVCSVRSIHSKWKATTLGMLGTSVKSVGNHTMNSTRRHALIAIAQNVARKISPSLMWVTFFSNISSDKVVRVEIVIPNMLKNVRISLKFIVKYSFIWGDFQCFFTGSRPTKWNCLALDMINRLPEGYMKCIASKWIETFVL